jgi:hypothetical protein
LFEQEAASNWIGVDIIRSLCGFIVIDMHEPLCAKQLYESRPRQALRLYSAAETWGGTEIYFQLTSFYPTGSAECGTLFTISILDLGKKERQQAGNIGML